MARTMSNEEAPDLTPALRVWHFAGEKLRDGRPLPGRGETLTHSGPVVPCERGLHGSVRAIDALRYAPGPKVALCELRGTIVAHKYDKHAASERHMLTGYVDATRVLHEFACWCAAVALDGDEAAGHTVDPRSRAAIAVKLAWLDGKATDKELTAARGAAIAAANSAPWDAAWGAMWDAAWASTAPSAASGATMAATWDAQNAELERRLTALLEASNG